MRVQLLVLSTLLAVFSGSAAASVITVDCTGGGDYLTLPEAMWEANSSDTVLLAPCVYAVGGPGWPITLTANSATIVGRDGAEVTILQGTGTETAFKINAGVYDARRYMSGLTFRDLRYILSKPGEDEGGPLLFTDNVVEYCTGGLDARSAGSSALVARNVFRYSGGISLYHNNGIVEYNELCYGSGGMVMHCCEVPKIRHNHIHHNTGTGIYTSFSCNVQYNVIEDNGGDGIWLYGSSGLVQFNTIRRNGTGVYVFTYPAAATLRNNDIYDNATYNLKLWTSPVSWQMSASPNWWGTTDAVEIAAGIWDCNDDPAIGGCMIFEPWCSAPGCGASAARPASWGSIKAMYR